MITVRRSSDRGHFDHGWLDTYHTFSFGAYRDPEQMGFSALRVINEDWVAPGMGFGEHPHRDMEIITYVLEGALEHRDSIGNGSILRAGMFQRMSAGTGFRHSEFNASDRDPVHLYQIWIHPATDGLTPSYEELTAPKAPTDNEWLLIAGPEGAPGTMTIHQDAALYSGMISPGSSLSYSLRPGRHAWIQVVRGTVRVLGEALNASDGAAVSDELELLFESADGAEVLLFDLP
ncbi:MAG: pirin family protein [Candidatus Hydrogenedentes bacterium]|nr:pirin family protein [Candidatus Hydrogenedentota bacterium]